MTEQRDNSEASLGGDVADFFGNLKKLETGEPYRDSMNPNGDPYASVGTAEKMVDLFASVHNNSLDILDQRIDDFYGVKPGLKNDNLPKEYTEAKAAIQEALAKKNK